jgi:DNA-directed RNA polymerase specialized sigma24 family protein
MRTPEDPGGLVPFPNDFELARLALSGDAAASREIVLAIIPQVEAFLLSRSTDSLSTEKSREIASDLPSDCLAPPARAGGERPLLELYQGLAPLRVWLTIVGHSRLKNFWRSPAYRKRGVNLEAYSEQPQAFDSAITKDSEVTELLRVALENAFARIEPAQVVYLRLVFLYGITRERIAQMLGTHASTVGREMNAAADEVKRLTLIFIKRLDPYLNIEWEDCLEICRKYPRLLHGDPVEVQCAQKKTLLANREL